MSTPILVKGMIGSGGFLLPSPVAHTAMFMLSSNRIVIGGLQGSTPVIAASGDGGQNFSASSVANAMKSVVGIHMYNDSEGIAVGTGSGSKFGVMKTTDGGASWTAVNSAPPMNAGETVIEKTAFFRGDGIWFATSSNRVVYSTNKGTTWAQGNVSIGSGQVVSVAFRDNSNGILLYRTSASANAPVLGARSVNGGAAWQVNAFDPSQLGVKAIAVSSPGSHHVLVGDGGEVFGSDNNGTDWQPILSSPNGAATTISCRLFEQPYLAVGGEAVGVLTYRYSGPNGSRILSAGASSLEYDTIESGKSRQRWLQLSSTGESDVIINSVTIEHQGSTPDSSFRISVPLGTVVAPGTTENLGIRCYATTPGPYVGKVTITSNATPPTIEASLLAFVTPPLSVEEDLLESGVLVTPNPASHSVGITLPLASRVILFDNTGRQLLLQDHEVPGTFDINVESLPSGMYTIAIASKGAIHSLPLQIVR